MRRAVDGGMLLIRPNRVYCVSVATMLRRRAYHSTRASTPRARDAWPRRAMHARRLKGVDARLELVRARAADYARRALHAPAACVTERARQLSRVVYKGNAKSQLTCVTHARQCVNCVR